jgi:hypothetical protein
MTPSILRIWLLCLGCVFLTGCVGASEWLLGPTQFQDSRSDLSPHFASIRIGVTAKQEIVSSFGSPTNRQMHPIDGSQVESLSYSTAESEIRPYQYIPLLGAIAFLGPIQSQSPSAAISFSSEGIVSGLTVSTLNAYGDLRSPERVPIGESSASFYGMSNPNVSHAPDHETHTIP